VLTYRTVLNHIIAFLIRQPIRRGQGQRTKHGDGSLAKDEDANAGADAGEERATSDCCAVLVEDGGDVTMEHCLVRNSRGLCMCVSGEGSGVTAKMCKFVEGAAGGILFENGGGGFVSECDIAANRQFGVLVTNGSEPVISSCLIHDGGAEGIVFFESGGLVSDCDVYKNTGVGICITQGSDPRVEQCRLFRGGSCGLLVQVPNALRLPPSAFARPAVV
jgi:hypothetical protein